MYKFSVFADAQPAVKALKPLTSRHSLPSVNTAGLHCVTGPFTQPTKIRVRFKVKVGKVDL